MFKLFSKMTAVERLALGTTNPAKIERYKKYLLHDVVDSISLLSDFDIKDKPTETGVTAEENAIIKATFYARKTSLLTLAVDEALYVDFVDYLPGKRQPGVFVRRIKGKREAGDSELLNYWAGIVSKVPAEERTGKWHYAYCLASPEGHFRTLTVDRSIRFYYPPSIIGIPGYPLNSIQGSADFNKPSSEYTKFERRQVENEMGFHVRSRLRRLIQDLKLGGNVVNYIR